MSDHDPQDDATRTDTPVTDPTMAMPAAAGGPPPIDEPPPTDEPPPPPDRRRWILAALVALIVAIGIALLLLDDDEDTASTSGSTTTTVADDTTTTTVGTTTTTSSTTTTASTTTTTSPPSTVPPGQCVSSGPDQPEPVAEVVYEAFTLDDRDCAENLATSDAIEQLFSIPGAGAGWTFQGCVDQDDPDPHTLCSYRFDGGSTSFRMSYSETEGWTVYEVFQAAD
jgi:hypothetical protein